MMKCSNIIERSIQYLDNALDVAEKKFFETHIACCDACKKKYLLIKSNYDRNINLENIPKSFKERVMIKVKQYKEPIYQLRLMKTKAVLLSICFIISISVTVFAKPIYKTLEQLIQAMGREVNMEFFSRPESRSISATLLVEERAKELFINNQEKIESISRQMKAGETKTLKYIEGKDILNVKIGVGKKSRSISYSLNNSNYKVIESISDLQYKEKFYTAQKKLLNKLIDNGYFMPVIEGLKQEYRLVSISTKDYYITSNKEVDSLIYENISGLQSVELNLNDVNIIKNANLKRSLEEVNGLQAIYEEGELYGKSYSRLHVFLGDDKRQKVLTIGEFLTPGSLEKEELLKIARSIRFFNEQNNYQSKENGILYVDEGKELEKLLSQEAEKSSSEVNCLKYFGDPMIRKAADEYTSMLRKGQRKFTIHPVSGVTLTRKSAKGVFFVEYKKTDYENILKWFKLPMFMNKDIYKDSVIDRAIVGGLEYQGVNSIGITYMLEGKGRKVLSKDADNTISVYVTEDLQRYKDSIHKYPILDIMIDYYVTHPMENAWMIYDQTNHPYIIDYRKQNVAFIYTIKKIDGRFVEYRISLPRSIVDEVGKEKFIQEFKIIK